jgi:protein TonB
MLEAGCILKWRSADQAEALCDGAAAEIRPMVTMHGSARIDKRVYGAIAWKLLLAVGVGVGTVWAATQVMSVRPFEEAPRAVTGAVATQPAVLAPDSNLATPAQSPPTASSTDPFAGVDVRNDSVLRHIAGIENRSRRRQATPPKRNAVKAAEISAPRGNDAPAPRENTVPEARPRAPAATVSVVATPAADPGRPAMVASQVQPAPEPVARAAVEPPNNSVVERAVKGPAVVPPASAPLPAAPERVVAAARTEAAAPAVAAPLRIAYRNVPVFPGEAIRAGIRSGRVVARLTIDADGRVTGTQVLSATPPGYFERESRRALATWRYDPPGQATTTDVELVFTRE